MLSSPVYSCTLCHIYIQQILAGTKTYEGRIFRGPFARYKVGTKVRWFAGSKSHVVTVITDVQKFSTLEEMIKTIGYQKLLPEVASEEEAVRIYRAIPHYQERVLLHGAVAFGLQVIPDPQPRVKRERSE